LNLAYIEPLWCFCSCSTGKKPPTPPHVRAKSLGQTSTLAGFAVRFAGGTPNRRTVGSAPAAVILNISMQVAERAGTLSRLGALSGLQPSMALDGVLEVRGMVAPRGLVRNRLG